MKRFLGLLAAGGLTLALSTPAFAVSPSERDCEGVFDRYRGTVSCTVETSDPVGNSERSNGKSQTVDSSTEESSKGTLNNAPKYDKKSECSGPGNGNSQAQCP